MDLLTNEQNITRASNFMKGLASKHRLMILCQLAEGEQTVTDLIKKTGMAQTSMSQHLGKLRQEGIVTFRRDHRKLYYSIAHTEAFKIMEILYNAFCNKNEEK